MIKQFNKENLPKIRTDMEEHLAHVASKYGLEINIERISFDENTFNAKLECKLPIETSSGDLAYGEEAVWLKQCTRYGFKPEDYKRKIKIWDGKEYLLKSFHPTARKYRVIVERLEDEVKQQMTIHDVKKYMAADPMEDAPTISVRED